MFIALVGTPSAGKKTILKYLQDKHGFVQISLDVGADVDAPAKTPAQEPSLDTLLQATAINGSSSSTTLPSATTTTFASTADLLDHVTRSWRSHYVTTSLTTYDAVAPFVKRPFFLLVAVDGPLRRRFGREKARLQDLSLEDFVDQHDRLLSSPSSASDYRQTAALANVSIYNHYDSIARLYIHLDSVNLLNEERLRPGWDMYFMTLASLASHRSNCMKRRVGALLVRSKRILSTGYNGTPRGLTNCNEGGCTRCNGSARGGEALNECLCLHAEENALLEAGRERVGEDSVLYCNTCPCLRCSVKIVQTGVREVVYNQSYSMDEASAKVLKEGGVHLRQLVIPN